MSKFNILNLASGIIISGDKIDKSDSISFADRYEKYQVFRGTEEERRAESVEMTNKFYSFMTPFYEYSFGESIHFAHRYKGETFRESIKRHEHFIALRLGLKPGQKVLDVGCGVGGPLREIAQFSQASVTGITNNEYQITRGEELNRVAGLDKTCNFVKGNFMDMPFPDNSFDAIYAIEATSHAPDAYGCYKEIFRVLKPGRCFAVYEWCTTDAFDPNNVEHQQIKANIEIGICMPDIRPATTCLEALEQAGFEVIFEKDVAKDSPVPWYSCMEKSYFSEIEFRGTPFGRFMARFVVRTFECLGLAPKGSSKILRFFEEASKGFVEGGRKEIITPMYFFLARKPE
ncbi:PREDICTED: cycloartenol-C-24-methyltransferase-like [Tarenaya hassleriana]|uniref:cycloartenol-C-24-methyltransferase-like n=1 Tax=Tarenaya hassleriana TaxID=28532 RepID=UPI00053C918E|nr:PREDICTED: cycloartenol-C-24-methyltransferase-like [Tarenaya hassleriana]XP_010547282.1 PREDICTED: cycloartenol-C-24-methyltransferase-like [Tarenaya hassleriana]